MFNILKLLNRLPAHKRNRERVDQTSERVTYVIGRYNTLEQKLKDEVAKNHIAERLVYDRGK